MAWIAGLFSLGYVLFLTNKYAVNILFWDEWDFYKYMFREHTWLDLFAYQHGPHRQGISFVILEQFNKLTHWDSRAESFFIFGVLTLAFLAAMVLKKYLFAQITWSDILVPFIVLSITQMETIVVTPNPSHAAFPLLMLMLYTVLTVNQGNMVLLAVLQICLVFTGFGLSFVPAAGLVIIGDYYRNKRRSIFLLTTLLISCALFLVHYNMNQTISASLNTHFLFVCEMYSRFVGLNNGGYLIVAISVSLLIFHFYRYFFYGNKLSASIVLLSGTSIWYAILTSMGRIGIASRYMTLMIPGFLALAFQVFELPKTYRNVVAVVLLIGVLHGSISFNMRGIKHFADDKTKWKDCYLKIEDIDACDEKIGFMVYPKPAATHLKQKLDYLKLNHLNLFKGE